MSLAVITHNGPFHADDVMAMALIRTFVDSSATVERTRDPARWATGDIVVDVGGVFDEASRRFDHHQATYTGERSSAGMVLDWLENDGLVPERRAAVMRRAFMDHVDAVDNGRSEPLDGVPDFSSIVSVLGEVATDQAGFDVAFEGAVDMASAYLRGFDAGQAKTERAHSIVEAAMDAAVRDGLNVLLFDDHCRWKTPYFARGGEEHPTEFVLFPGHDGSWRIVCIPPVKGSFAQKRSLPEAWAGLTDEALEEASGIEGAVFCHRNRFIAVFKTREACLKALDTQGMYRR